MDAVMSRADLEFSDFVKVLMESLISAAADVLANYPFGILCTPWDRRKLVIGNRFQ